MEWRYAGKPYIKKHSDELYGFIYCVTFEREDGELYSYYGQKKMISEITKHFGKRKLATVTDKRLKTYETVIKESNWRIYIGSCQDTKGYIPVSKEIISFAESKRQLTYMETKLLFVKSALEDPKCLNRSILKRFFKDNLI